MLVLFQSRLREAQRTAAAGEESGGWARRLHAAGPSVRVQASPVQAPAYLHLCATLRAAHAGYAGHGSLYLQVVPHGGVRALWRAYPLRSTTANPCRPALRSRRLVGEGNKEWGAIPPDGGLPYRSRREIIFPDTYEGRPPP